MRIVITGALVAATLLLAASTARAGIKPPHDESNGIECLDCHALSTGDLGISLPRFADQELLCKTCHNPTGQAATMTEVGLHVVNGGATVVDCGSCHSVHYPQLTSDPVHTGGVEAENLHLIRGDTATYVPGALEPAIFHAPTDYAFDTAPFNGVCQTCHTSTAYHDNAGAGGTAHGAGQDCSSCHGHSSGFPASCTGCHASAQDNGDGVPLAGRRGLASEFALGVVHAHAGGASITDADCGVCHAGGLHADGEVELLDPDGGFTLGFETTRGITGQPDLKQFCGNCHDADGAVASAAPLAPFGGGKVPADIADKYALSGHADVTSKAFTYGSITGKNCAKCHTEHGFRDFLGADGSASGTVDAVAPAGSTVSCVACHNQVTAVLSSVTFPSTVTVTGLGKEAVCMQCHQGRESMKSVDDMIALAAPADDDTVSSAISFKNLHYAPAGATLMGGVAKVGYQYAGKTYDSRNMHVTEADTCIECHDAHSGKLDLDLCATCHTGVTTVADIEEIRMFGSTGDYDGDGDRAEGIKHELEGVEHVLLDAIYAYAVEVAGTPIVYDAGAHPYFFIDTNGNGVSDAGEATGANKYVAWTARLARAAFNYQFLHKDAGGYAHHPKYLVELGHDSVVDLNGALTAPVAFAGEREDAGHFDGASEAWRHWDGDGEVPSSCAKCHSPTGYLEYLETGANTNQHVSNGLSCVACHASMLDWSLRTVDSVTYPGGTVVSAPGNKDNLCATCHSGRESKATVDAAIAAGKLGFKNVHYLPAAAVLNGSVAQVGYQYDGKTYAGKWVHYGPASSASCTFCHDPEETKHTFDVLEIGSKCAGCHGSPDVASYRWFSNTTDYDGDGDVSEGLHGEIVTMEDALYVAMQSAATAAGTPLVYSASSYPYFFKDLNGNGVADPNEASYANGFKGWTPELMKAAFNFQLAHKEPGAWAHNFDYVAQLLFDSIEDLGGDVSALTRP